MLVRVDPEDRRVDRSGQFFEDRRLLLAGATPIREVVDDDPVVLRDRLVERLGALHVDDSVHPFAVAGSRVG